MAMSVVALRAAGLGDLLTAVPALRALAAHAPVGTGRDAAGVRVAVPRWLHPLVELIPGLRGPIGVDGLRPRWTPSGTLAVNLHGSGPQSHRALLATHPERLLAFAHPQVWSDGPGWFDEEPERDRWCRLLRWAGIPADPTAVGIRRPAVECRAPGALVLHLGASDPQRRWPAERFATLARELRGERPVLTGTSADLPLATWVAEQAGLGPDAVLTGRLSLTRLAALVADARLVVSADTGVAHLASAYRTPSVTVFGPASPLRWGPPPEGPHRIVRGAGSAPAAAAVRPGAVLDHVTDLLGQARAA
jgi:ADP-heptose:LPS heptosyltransferase